LHFHWNDLLHFFSFRLVDLPLECASLLVNWMRRKWEKRLWAINFIFRKKMKKKILSTFCVLAPSLCIDLIFRWMQTFLTIRTRFGRLINYISRNLMKEWTVLISSVIMIRLSWMEKKYELTKNVIHKRRFFYVKKVFLRCFSRNHP
jgi:hypothetical protein